MNYDFEWIQRWKQSDSIIEVVLSRAAQQDEYTDSQLALIETVLSLTLKADPAKRISTMQPIDALLKKLTEQPR